MSTTDTNVWDYVVTYGGPSLFMTAVFLVVMPLIWFKLARPRFERWPSRLAVMLAVWLAAWLLAYGDVLMIAREAKRVCETEAGLKVYRTVEVEGFAGTSDIEYWSTQGFSFVESRQPDGTIFRYVPQGEPIRLALQDEMKSKFEYVYLGWTTPKDRKNFYPNTRVIRDIISGEIIGQLVMFSMRYGWLDSPFASSTGAQNSYCQGGVPVHYEELEHDGRSFISAVLKPIHGDK
ncbi:MAG TPA: hypothetical protein PJ986_12445 [Gammaproteobacteria bacterium]|nr:hypothetical protein [Gammaproteobacteria bacterium]